MPLSPDEGYSGSPDRAVLVPGSFGDAPGFVVTSISFSQNAAVYASGTYQGAVYDDTMLALFTVPISSDSIVFEPFGPSSRGLAFLVDDGGRLVAAGKPSGTGAHGFEYPMLGILYGPNVTTRFAELYRGKDELSPPFRTIRNST